ncbi:hypothetical protein OEA41_009249 [Lepraria neglecta]|uniref:Uncharacterized protein n=1 Tax=Lepraria neglecta TaxID=209136 RepID=A0AAD9Z1G4_9LECA|nr:hypothetical protein OEA41_009249 [Lepraria neglecta]
MAQGQCGQVGSVIESATIPYAPTALQAWGLDDIEHGEIIVYDQTIDYGSLFSNCTTQSNFNYGAAAHCDSGQTDSVCMSSQSQVWSSLRSLGQHCYPQLLFPFETLIEMVPAWSSCNKAPWVYDPPRALVPTAVLAGVPTKGPDPPITAAPASQISEPVAPMTLPPSRVPATGPAKTPPSVADPIDPEGSKTPALAGTQIGQFPTNDSPEPASSLGITLPQSGQSDPEADDAPSNTDSPLDEFPSNRDSRPVDPAPAQPRVSMPTFALNLGDGQTLSAALVDPTAVLVGDSTIEPGGPAVQVLGHQVSVDPAASDIVVDGEEHALPLQTSPSTIPTGAVVAGFGYGDSDSNIAGSPGPTTTLDGHFVQALPSGSGAILVDGQRINIGDPPTSVSGVRIALHENGDVVLGSLTISQFLPASPTVSYFTVGGQVLTFSQNQLEAPGTTLSPGNLGFDINGTSISLGSSALQIGTSIIPVSTPTTLPLEPIITAAGQLATILPAGLAIAGTTITPSGRAITISGTRISLGNSGLMVGTSTIALDVPSTPPLNLVFTAAGQLVTLLPTGVVVAGTLISANAPAITVSGTRMSFGSNGLVIGTSTIALTLPTLLGLSPVITTLGQTLTIDPNGVSVSGTMLRIGDPAITILGTPIALQSNEIVIGTSTLPFPNMEPSHTGGLADFIVGGLNGDFADSTTTSSPAALEDSSQVDTGSASDQEALQGLAAGLDYWSSGLVALTILLWFYMI